MKKLLCIVCLLIGVLFFNPAEAYYHRSYASRHHSYARHYRHRPVRHYYRRPVRHSYHRWHRHYW